MQQRRPFIFLVLFLGLLPSLYSQIQVEMRIPRRLYIAYEPIVVTVGITNLTGRDITLQDIDNLKWFSFQVNTADDRIVPPLDLNYKLSPLTIAAGETVKRQLNLTTLYAVHEFGLYHIKASVYFGDTQKYYSSQSNSFEVTEGKLVYHQTVGVPEGQEGAGTSREISLLTHRNEKYNILYIRVEDRENGLVYTTTPLGRIVLSYEPQVALDRKNQIHVLHLFGPRAYVYSRIGLNGEWLGQANYNVVKAQPTFKKMPDGSVAILGGKLDIPANPAAGAPATPKLSDRPPGLPKDTQEVPKD
jgi:hypothetical protein